MAKLLIIAILSLCIWFVVDYFDLLPDEEWDGVVYRMVDGEAKKYRSFGIYKTSNACIDAGIDWAAIWGLDPQKMLIECARGCRTLIDGGVCICKEVVTF